MAVTPGVLFNDPRVKPLSTTGQFQPGCYYCFSTTLTTTLANVYADGALTTPLSQPTPGSVNPSAGTVSATDGRFVPIYLDPSVVYRARLYSAAGALLEDTDPYSPNPLTAAQITAAEYFTDAGSVNALAITGTGITALTAGLIFAIKVATTTTSQTVTLNVQGLGAKPVITPTGALPIAGALVGAGIYFFVYDGANFQIVGATANTNIETIVNSAAGKTFALADVGTTYRVVGAAGVVTLTIPKNTTVAFPVGTRLPVINDALNGFNVAISPASGVTLNMLQGAKGLIGIGNRVTLEQVSLDNWAAYETQEVDQSFTCAWSGFSAQPPQTNCLYSINGSMATISIPVGSNVTANQGTSNATTFSMTGLPAELVPSHPKLVASPFMTDNGTSVNTATAVIGSGGAASITFFKDSNFTGWTASGAKGFNLLSAQVGYLTLTYSLI